MQHAACSMHHAACTKIPCSLPPIRVAPQSQTKGGGRKNRPARKTRSRTCKARRRAPPRPSVPPRTTRARPSRWAGVRPRTAPARLLQRPWPSRIARSGSNRTRAVRLRAHAASRVIRGARPGRGPPAFGGWAGGVPVSVTSSVCPKPHAAASTREPLSASTGVGRARFARAPCPSCRPAGVRGAVGWDGGSTNLAQQTISVNKSGAANHFSLAQ
jgi:hypothetical protein